MTTSRYNAMEKCKVTLDKAVNPWRRGKERSADETKDEELLFIDVWKSI